jgi:AmiR/NasT family two-component response regulator
MEGEQSAGENMSGSGRAAGDYNVQVLAQIRQLVSQLQAALTRQVVIDQAVGIMINRHGRSARDVLDHLHAISQIQNRTLVDVAQRIVEEAVRHTRSENSNS